MLAGGISTTSSTLLSIVCFEDAHLGGRTMATNEKEMSSKLVVPVTRDALMVKQVSLSILAHQSNLKNQHTN